MRFRTLLFLGIGALVAVSLFCGALAAVTLHMTARSAERISQHVVEDLETLHEVRLTAEQLVAAGRVYLLTERTRDRARMTELNAALDRSLDKLSGHDRGELSPPIALVEQTATEYARVIITAAEQRARGDAVVQDLEAEVAPRMATLERAIADLTDLEENQLEQSSERAGRAVRTVGLTTLVACLLAVGIGFVLAVVVSRRLAGRFLVEQSEKDAAKAAAISRRELLDIVSHDLRSPLNAIVLGLDVLRHEHGEARHIALIAHSAERMRRLVDDLLDASKAEIAELELVRAPHEPRAVLERIVEQFHDLAQAAGVQLREECTVQGPIMIDRERILQILGNLVGNAIKFTRAGDEVVVRATQQGDRTRFAVSDAGPGVPDAEQAFVFEAYKQGSGTVHRGGIGLGLYICKKLVEAHGGRIGVNSAEGRGSTFWFDLPA